MQPIIFLLIGLAWVQSVLGFTYPTDCYQYILENNSFTKSFDIKLHTGAFDGAYAQWRNSGIIVAGGRNHEGINSILQIVTESVTAAFWQMNFTIIDSCLVHIHDDSFLLIGGVGLDARSIIIEPKLGK